MNYYFKSIKDKKELSSGNATRGNNLTRFSLPLSVPFCSFFYRRIKQMNDFLEKTLEDIIFETSNDDLKERGLWIGGNKKRQVKIGNYGVADLITYEILQDISWNSYLNITVFELKRKELNSGVLMQSIGYAKGIMEYLKTRNFTNYKISIVLIGGELNLHDNFIYIPSLFADYDGCGFSALVSVHYYTYSYKFNGIFFDDANSYNLINKGF